MRGLTASLLVLVTACNTTSGDPPPPSVTGVSATAPAPDGWVEVAPMKMARSEHPGAVLHGEVVVVGGFVEVGVGRTGVTDTVEAYDPESDAWRDLSPLPSPVNHGMAAVVSDRLFAIGGYSEAGDPLSTVWELVDDAWVERAPLPGPVGAGAAVALDDSIYVVGGIPAGGLYLYNVTSDAWSELTTPGTQREHVAAAPFEGEIWAIAGRWDGKMFNTVEIYDPVSGSWRPGPDLNEARSGFGATVIDGTIVVAGGEVFEPNQALNSVERLEAGSERWALIEPLPLGIHGNPLLAIGSDLYLPGGSIRAADIENEGRSFRLFLE